MYRVLWLLVLSVLLLLTACGGDNKDVATELDLDRQGFTAYFDLSAGVLPFPTNLLFSGSVDGTLNIPVADATDISDPKVAMNALDGFSTVAPISTSFSSAIDPSTLTPATVRVFEATLDTFGGALPVGGPINGIVDELTFGVDFVATLSSVDPSGSTLVILPLKPLNPSSHYLVALSDGIKGAAGSDPQTSAHYLIAKSGKSLVDGSGTSQHPSMDDAEAATFESVRQLVNAQEAYLGLAGVDTDSTILSWTFSTQSVGNVLGIVNAVTKASPAPVSALVATGASSPLGAADLYAGTLDIPYYLTAAADNHDATPLGTWWQALNPAFAGDLEKNLTHLNPLPVATSTETIPLLVSIPKATKPGAGWPVVIFQHGITQNRTSMLAVADSLAAAGFAVVAIDMPLHGLTGDETDEDGNPHLVTAFRMPGLERIFDLDLTDNTTGAPGPDGTIDASGTHYINLSSLLTTRDNGRQVVADLFSLKAALETMDYDSGGADFDTANIHFVGHSLGAMVGTGFLSTEPTIKASVLGMPGGGVAKLLDGSASFGPRIAAGLAAKGVAKGTADFESFMGAFQTVIDAADPINYATNVGVGRGVMLYEVLGDTVVPNNVMADAPTGTVPSPLAGTDPLAREMKLEIYDGGNTPPATDLVQLRFISGDHSSILDPTGDPLVTSVMQTAMATFLATDGAVVTVSDASVLE
jgi:dienelactone hydrolase